MKKNNWGGYRPGSGKKPNWTILEKIVIGSKCERIQKESIRENSLEPALEEQKVTVTDYKSFTDNYENLASGDRDIISDKIKWIEKDIQIGESYEDIEAWLLEEREKNLLSDKDYVALYGYLEKKEHKLYRAIITPNSSRGINRKKICEKVSEQLRNNEHIRQPSPATVNNIWKWYRKEIIGKQPKT